MQGGDKEKVKEEQEKGKEVGKEGAIKAVSKE